MLERLEQPRLNKNLLYRYNKANEPTKKGPLSFVLFESPFTSVSGATPLYSLSDYYSILQCWKPFSAGLVFREIEPGQCQLLPAIWTRKHSPAVRIN